MNLLVNIDVPDLSQGEKFYVEAFDLKVGRRLGEGFVELLGLEAPIYLLETKTGSSPFPGANTARNFERHWSPVHFDLTVPDLEHATMRVLAAGAKRESGPRQTPYGKISTFSDPFGHGFCLIQFEGRGYDEIAE